MNKPCGFCGKTFHAYRQKLRFCSQKCGAAGRSGPKRTNTGTKSCPVCGNEITGGPSHLAAKTTCGRECYRKLQALRQQGANNHNYRNSGQKVCQGCGKQYQSYTKTRRFCGTDCAMTQAGTSAMRSQQLGRDAEHRCQAILDEMGYLTLRTKNSRGAWDVMGLGPSGVIFIQVKATASNTTRSRTQGVREIARIPFTPSFNGEKSRRKQVWCWVGGKSAWHITEVMPDGSEAKHWV